MCLCVCVDTSRQGYEVAFALDKEQTHKSVTGRAAVPNSGQARLYFTILAAIANLTTTEDADNPRPNLDHTSHPCNNQFWSLHHFGVFQLDP